jgi:hydroxymethylpyrimidine pyrophosphatase-like HAD family hydrolase
MLTSSDIMYCFDLDGTILDSTSDINFITRNYSLIKSKCIFNPSCKYDIRWNIVTSRPKKDLFYIWLSCFKNHIIPCQIFTYDGNIKILNHNEYSAQFKTDLFKSILDGAIQPKYTTNKINKIIYICNNIDEVTYINSNKNIYPIVSLTIIDFIRECFLNIV